MTERGSPLLRPVVVSSSTGMFCAVHPTRPPLTVSMMRWMAFMALSAMSAGMRGIYPQVASRGNRGDPQAPVPGQGLYVKLSP